MSESIQGSLFSSDFVRESIATLPDWQAVDEAALRSLTADLTAIFESFPTRQTPNESQTEDDLIWPVLVRLGWTASLRQQNLAPRGREDVPDGILFADDNAKGRANRFAEEWKRYELGLTLIESKRWLRPLDRRSGRRGEETAPSTQMLRYLRRVDDLTTGKLRWGILTNGARWRLYYQGARSVSEQFFEINLPAVLGLPGHNEGLFALSGEERAHYLKVFALVFRRDAFLPGVIDARTFHQRALEEGQFYEERVATNLSNLVFGQVFPELARAIAGAAPDAPLQEVREAALIFLYRLLFILYAEDRDLLPVRDERYDDYSLRDRVRGDVGTRKDRGDVFSETAARYWSAIDDLCRAINQGDGSIGLPPYNGGLFDEERTPLLTQIRLGDRAMADIVDALSFERTPEGRHYINYRDLSVQQLGSIYERLLEHEIVRDDGSILIRPNLFARKVSGSYYTPEDLVGLIIREAVEPLAQARIDAFRAKSEELSSTDLAEDRRIGQLKRIDPAEKILEFKVCDPAMGSGHFLVSLVDFLADQVIAAMAEAETAVEWGDYISPLAERIDTIRNTILANAEQRGWTIDEEQLDDRHIIRRMVLKRCIYGVDKNPMAVELAKVSLWLHTFTVGAPLSFLDHHLRCGDSLFGSWVKAGIEKATAYGGPLLLHQPITRALRAASKMQIIEGLTDAEIAEAHRSADVFAEIEEMTAPLAFFLSLIHALDWMQITNTEDRRAIDSFFNGALGDPVLIATGQAAPDTSRENGKRFAAIFERVRELIREERFLHWEVAFPGVWTDWEADRLTGGFDAVIGNPPWDRIKMQQVEWFAARKPEIAQAPRAADRKRMIKKLEEAADPLATDYAKAAERAEAMSRLARRSGVYPLLSGGDTNLNSLFVEQASHLVKPTGMVGLLIPSGISTETTAQEFFSGLIERRNASCCFDFFNRRLDGTLFFPDVYYRFKFTAFVFSGPEGRFEQCRFATFVRDLSELDEEGRIFSMGLDHFRHVNPNSATAPIYRAQRDREISTVLYDRIPPLVLHDGRDRIRSAPVRYVRMFDMANDSGLFRTHEELREKEGAWPEQDSCWRSANGRWVPLYEGKMVQAFDHRASGIAIVESNLYRTAQAATTTPEQYADPTYAPEPRYFVHDPGDLDWEVAIKDVTSTTNARSIIATLIPPFAAGHTLPILKVEGADRASIAVTKAHLVANLNATMLDFVARTKILSNHASWYILEQLPMIEPAAYQQARFGSQSASHILCDAVLELTYTAHNMAAFAADMGYAGGSGAALSPFVWNEDKRQHLRAKIDAVFFHLYGISDRNDVRYVFSTFPIVEEQEMQTHGIYRSRELCLAYMNAFAAGSPDADVRL